MTANTIQITPFGKDTETIDINQIASDFFGHGGGDKRMVEDFIDMLTPRNGPSGHTTTVEQSVESHYCAFAAEESDYTTALLWSLTNSENRTVSRYCLL